MNFAPLVLFGCYLPLSPGIDIFLLPKQTLIAAGAALALNFSSRERPQRRLRLAFWAVILTALASAALSASPLQSVIGAQRSSTAGVLGLVLAYLCYEAAEPGWESHLLVAAAICADMALLQPLIQFPLPPVGTRLSGFIGSPPMLGCMLALAAPVAARQRRWWVLGLLTGVVYLTGSRAALLGLAAGLGWEALSHKGRLWTALALASAAVLCVRPGANDGMRMQTWVIAWKAFCEHPLFGVGPDNFTDAFQRLRSIDWQAGAHTVQDNAHNLPLHILATQGLVGAWAWLNLGRRAKITPSLAAVLVYGLFDPTPFMAWCVVAYQAGATE